MHKPFCTIEQHCQLCDLHRADREISRLRGTLRTVMDSRLDKMEAIKDLNKKVHRLEVECFELSRTMELVQEGKLSAADAVRWKDNRA